MNKRGNNPWILCPSKSFPGKLYYFNLVTGETAWCLTEEEKNTLAKDAPIKKVPDKNHSFPEPTTSPTDNGQDFPNICYNFTTTPTMPLNYHVGPPQIFGQPIISRYIPNQFMPGYMMPMPQMYMTNKPEAKKRSFDQITQTSDDSVRCVQGYTQPLSIRFGSYYTHTEVKKNPTKAFVNKGISPNTIITDNVNRWNNNSTKHNDSTMQGSVFGSKLNEYNKHKESTNDDRLFRFNLDEHSKVQKKSVFRHSVHITTDKGDPIEIRKTIFNDSYKNTDNVQKQILIQDLEIKAKHSQESQKLLSMNSVNEHCPNQLKLGSKKKAVAKDICVQNPLYEDLPKLPSQQFILNSYDSLVSSLNETNDIENDARHQLGNNDLRLVLQARRRKSVVVKETQKIISNDLDGTNEEKKQVSFDLLSVRQVQKDVEVWPAEESEVKSEIISENDVPTAPVINISYLKNLSKPFLKTNPWYVVVDIGVLLDEFDFIEDFVKKDVTCRLLVPISVRSYIETMSVGEYAGRSRVMLARKAMRRLAAPSQHLALQPPITDKPLISAIDGTIECCLQVLQCNHAVLITTDTELYEKGITAGIDTYKLADVKQSLENEPQVTFKIGKITINNDNIFMQNTNEFEPFPLSKKVDLPGNDAIDKVPRALMKSRRLSVEVNKADSNNTVINDKMAGNNSNIFKFPTVVKKSKKTLVLNEVNSNTVVSNNLSESVYLNNNMPNQELKDTKQLDGHIEDDIKFLSLHENKTPNKKLSDNFTSLPQSNFKQDFRKIIITTNVQTDDGKDENLVEKNENLVEKDENLVKKLKTEQRRNLCQKDSLNLSNIQPEVTSTSEVRMRKPLAVSKSVLQSKSFPKDEGRRLTINAYTMAKMLKRFQINDASKNRRIASRLDEWVCCFHQIMEDCLADVLINYSSSHKLTAPWCLLEAVLCVKDLYSTNASIKTISDKLCSILSNLTDKNDNLTDKIKPVDFMKLFGCGLLLVETLKIASPQITQVVETEKLLNNLLHRIQDPSEDEELPVRSVRDMRCEIDDTDSLNRNIVQKKPSEILDYLKRHFPAWKNFDESELSLETSKVQKKDVRNETTILRSYGKNLNTIRISKANKITFDDTTALKAPKFKENIKVTVEKEAPKYKTLFKTINDVKDDTPNEKNTKDNGSCKDMNRKTDKVEVNYKNNNKSMVYSNWNESVDDDKSSLDHFVQNNDSFADDMIIKTDVNAAPCKDTHVTENKDVLQDNVEELSLFDRNSDGCAPVNDDIVNCNDSMDDSGFVNQSLDACSFIRMFLFELSTSFKLIYKFIDTSIQEFRCDVISQETKRVTYDKANKIHLYVADIIGKLRRIIDREASEKTKLKSLVINAGIEALADKRLTRYRQVVIKCLEQAQLLEGALKTVLALTNEHCDITAMDIDRPDTHVPYFNIFE